MLAQGVQLKKLGAQQRQHLHCAPLSHVLKLKMLEEQQQQQQHVNRRPPGPAKLLGSMPISK